MFKGLGHREVAQAVFSGQASITASI